MSHVTALLIVMTLTGSPVTSAVCAMVCGHDTAPAAHCHESMPDAADVAIAADITCGALVSDVPYLKENLTSPQLAAMTAVADFDMPQLLAGQPPREHKSAGGAWLKPPVVLRR